MFNSCDNFFSKGLARNDFDYEYLRKIPADTYYQNRIRTRDQVRQNRKPLIFCWPFR